MPKKNMDYSKNVIYKIVCNDLNVKMCYVGHTTDFIRRKYKHKSDCNNENSEKHNLKIYKEIRQNGGWDNFTMVEIEKYPCNDNNEAATRERYYYELLNANLNHQVPNRTHKESIKEYKAQNKDKIKKYHNEYNKEYNVQNKDKIKEYYKIKMDCDCGSIICKSDKNKHIKTIKHQKYISQLN